MKILGVDPGTLVTGYGIIDVDLRGDRNFLLIEAGTIEPSAKAPLLIRVQKIYKNLSDIVVQYKPVVMVLEKLYSHYKHPTTACKLGHVRGVICLVCAHHEIQLEEQSVKRIRKSLVGDGNATKEQTREVVAHALRIDATKLSLDASDALALALGYAFMQRYSKS
jgi:crossover junction endodeoxyribonuclease RuvC